MQIPNYYHRLKDSELLIFKSHKGYFEIFSKHESSQETKIAEMRNGKWVFEDFYQQKLFFNLFQSNRYGFEKAIKCFNKYIQPKKSIFNCFKRKTKIKFKKFKKHII
jgi:hypothetical protein